MKYSFFERIRAAIRGFKEPEKPVPQIAPLEPHYIRRDLLTMSTLKSVAQVHDDEMRFNKDAAMEWAIDEILDRMRPALRGHMTVDVTRDWNAMVYIVTGAIKVVDKNV